MSIEIVQGDILTSGADAIVIPVNCVGVAGKGLALAAKKKWPEWFAKYKHHCLTESFEPGQVASHTFDLTPPNCPRYIISAATKGHWRSASRVIDIGQCLAYIRAWALRVQPDVLAIPALGCGEGRLSWPLVRDMAERTFDMDQFQGDLTLRTTVRLYAPL